MGKLLKGGLSGGLILFIWSTLSWNVFDWQNHAFDSFPSESLSNESELIQKIPAAGMYRLSTPTPTPTTAHLENNSEAASTALTQRQVLVSIQKESQFNESSIQLVISLLAQVSAALLITALLLLKPHMQYTKRVLQVLLFAAAAGVVTYIPYMNQLYFSLQYTLIAMLNLLVGWLFASFAIAYFTRPNYPRFY